MKTIQFFSEGREKYYGSKQMSRIPKAGDTIKPFGEKLTIVKILSDIGNCISFEVTRKENLTIQINFTLATNKKESETIKINRDYCNFDEKRDMGKYVADYLVKEYGKIKKFHITKLY